WLCNDILVDTISTDMLTDNTCLQNPNYYVHYPAGLFPAPLSPHHPTTVKVSKMFHFLGIFIARALQDSRLVDLPLSTAFLKLICMTSSTADENVRLNKRKESIYNRDKKMTDYN